MKIFIYKFNVLITELESVLLIGRTEQGTRIHPDLVIQLAQWISKKLEHTEILIVELERSLLIGRDLILNTIGSCTIGSMDFTKICNSG